MQFEIPLHFNKTSEKTRPKKKKTAFEKLTFYTQSTTNAEHKAGGF